ncbi:MAG: DUF642 domain-containing protein [Acidimicrobiales bacterium]
MKKLLASSAIVAVVASALPLATAAALDGSPVTVAVAQEVQLNSDGCPEFLGTALDGAHCDPWPVSFYPQVKQTESGCSEALFMLVPLNPNVDEYVVSWSWDTPEARAHPWTFTATGGPHGSGSGPYGEEQWSTTALTPANTGVNVNYQVPSGFGAWFVAAGGGPGDCDPQTGVAQGWAVTYKRAVSGTITVAGSGAPAPGITVEGNCNGGGGTTTTNAQGEYELLVDKGPCTVTPQLVNGLKATPVSRSFDVESNVYNVDFVVPCGALPAEPASTEINGSRQPDVLTPAVSSSPADCLQVFIKIVGPIPNVGTRSGLSVDNYVPDDGPVNFTRLTGAPHEATPLVAIHQVGQQCVSGCANILITVVNKATHEPAANAEVDVQLGTIDTAESPSLHQQGRQFLCLQTDSAAQDCGTSLDRLKTDDNGQIRLLYWAPGELVTAHVELYAQVCTPSSCSLKRTKSKITVYPYRIFHSQGELPPEEVRDLVQMVQTEQYFDIASHAAEKGLEASAEGWMELLGVESHAVELALGPIGFAVAFLIIDLAHATSELIEDAGLQGAFFTATGLSEAGLGVGYQSSAFKKKLGWFDEVYFRERVLKSGTVLTYSSGWLWELAKQWSEKYGNGAWRTGGLFKPEPINLSVYETSYCQVGAHCGPGYGSLHSPDIRTDLCIYISQLGSPTCGIYYDAPIWVASQMGVDEKLNQHNLDTSLASSPTPPEAVSPDGTVTNGGFAQPVVSAELMYQGYAAGSTAIPGWTIGGDGVEVYASSFMQHPAGTTSEVRLFGSGPGSISQTIATTPGKTYVLQWYGAGEPGGGQAVKTMHVFWDGKLVAAPTFDTTGRSFTDMGWKALKLTVTASSPTSTIEFIDATSDKSFWGSMVTGVSLRASS